MNYMANLKSILKQKYSNKTLNEFDEIESAPSDYDTERRRARRSSRLREQDSDRAESRAKDSKAFIDNMSKIAKKRKADKITNNKIMKGREKAITGVKADKQKARIKPVITEYKTPKNITEMSRAAGSKNKHEGELYLGKTKVKRGNLETEQMQRLRADTKKSKATAAKFDKSQTPQKSIEGRAAIRGLEQRKSGLELAPTEQRDMNRQFQKALKRKNK